MIVRRGAQPQGFGFWDLLLGAVSNVLGQANPSTQCPQPPPLTFVQTPAGLAVTSGGALMLGIGLGALMFKGRR